MAHVSRIVGNASSLYRAFPCGLSILKLHRQDTQNLFTAAALGIDNYCDARQRVKQQFINISGKFFDKMRLYSEPTSTNLIFSEDLKNVVHLVEANSEDMQLVGNMIKKFCQQNKQARFGSFIFGPVVMRMFHHLDKPQEALALFRDPDLKGFFDQLTSYQIIMDLLFRNNMYNEVLEIYDAVISKQIQSVKYPKNVIVLTIATLYKMNTKESFEQASEIWTNLQNVGHIPTRKTVAFMAALALNQNAPHIALEVISGVKNQAYISIRSIKVSALADVGRPEDTLPILRSILEADNSNFKSTIGREVMDKVKDAIQKSENSELLYEFEQLEKSLGAGGHIDDQTLDNILSREIEGQPRTFRNDSDSLMAASFNRQQRPRLGVSNLSRQGLIDRY